MVNKVRAFAESPIAFFNLGEDRIKVYKAKVASNDIQREIGKILSTKKRFLIQAKNGVFEILKCQSAGGKILDAASFLNGYRFKTMAVNL